MSGCVHVCSVIQKDYISLGATGALGKSTRPFTILHIMQKLWILVIVARLYVTFLAKAVAAIVEENPKLCQLEGNNVVSLLDKLCSPAPCSAFCRQLLREFFLF